MAHSVQNSTVNPNTTGAEPTSTWSLAGIAAETAAIIAIFAPPFIAHYAAGWAAAIAIVGIESVILAVLCVFSMARASAEIIAPIAQATAVVTGEIAKGLVDRK